MLHRSRSDDEADEEIDHMKAVVEEHRGASLGRLFGSRMRQLLFVGLALAIFQQLIGVNTVIYYSATILKLTGINNTQSIGEALFVGITNVVLTIVAILLLDRVGRRVLLLTGTVGAGLALGLLGAFFQSPTLQHDASWVGFVALIVFIASFAVGLGPVFWLMISEIFPLGIRSKAMSVCTAANWTFNFLISYFFLQLIAGIGTPGTFWLYAGFGLVAVLVFALRVPETRTVASKTSSASSDPVAENGPDRPDRVIAIRRCCVLPEGVQRTPAGRPRERPRRPLPARNSDAETDRHRSGIVGRGCRADRRSGATRVLATAPGHEIARPSRL